MRFDHISFYKFVRIEDLVGKQRQLRSVCRECQLKGTILLAHEGINAMLSGNPDSVSRFVEKLTRASEFSDIEIKRTKAPVEPFKKLFVKIKKEIITFKQRHSDPAEVSYLSPQQLRKMLEEAEAPVLLDVRNHFEVRQGTFSCALEPEITSFSQFAKYAERNLDSFVGKKVVTFCTGGIRCEKAAAFLKDRGISEVYKLQGGILAYLEKTDGKFFEGNCFVFDDRIALDKNLRSVR